MKPVPATVVLGALINVAASNSTAESAESGNKVDLNYRLSSGLRSFHGLGGVNLDLVKYVLSGIQNGASDVLVAVPTQVGRTQQFGFNGFNGNDVVPSYQFGRPPLPPYPVPFPPGGPYKGGGYRGVKSLPVTPVGGGYRGVPPPAVAPLASGSPLGAQVPKNPSAVERPFRPMLPQDVFTNDEQPIRDGRFDKGSSWRPEIVVDKSDVIRDDKEFRPALRPDAVYRPDSGVRPISEPKPPRERPRPAVVPVTDDGPPSKDFISKLEADLVAGLTPQQLEELSFQAIDPRTVESKASKGLNGKIIFPGRVV